MARQSLNSNCRAQIDLRLNNAQLLDISSGQELLGRDDIYRPLLNARFRTQLVSVSNIGGWVVDGEEDLTAAQLDEGGLTAWNCHLGIKFHSINAFVALPQLFAIKDCASNLLKDANPQTAVKRNRRILTSKKVLRTPMKVQKPSPTIVLSLFAGELTSR